jgi:hypothetical protein
MRGNATTSRHVERWRCVKRMRGKGNASRGNASTPFGCPGEERQGEARGVPRRGYLCGDNR